MRLRSKILLSHALLAAAVMLICVAIVAAIRIADSNRRQLQQSYEQIRNINLVAATANDFAEQIAELFVLGLDDAEIQVSRERVLDRIDVQRTLIEGELEIVSDPVERAEELAELGLMNDMAAMVDDLDRLARSVIGELAAGRRDEAVAIYARDIENRFDAILGEMITEAMDREKKEIEAALGAASALSQRSTLLAIGLIGVAGTLGLGNAIFLNRAILRPIASLAEGTDAVARGELDHIVAFTGSDELGHLARRFNHMTSQVRDQHGHLVAIQAGLEDEVAARTAELRARSEELEVVNTRLRAVDASRAQFFADISHELRTPITILRGQAEVALRRPAPSVEEQNQTLHLIVAKAGQIGRLVDDLLFLARSDEGTIGVALGPVVLQDVLGDVLLDSQGLPRRSEVAIRPYQPEAPIVVLGDPDRLRQVLTIALDNALKLAPSGTTVDVEIAREGENAMMRVRDEGPGFSEDEIASAFTRFYRGEVARARTGRGMGLGLSIAKWIVERHGGTIRIAGRSGPGALVEVALPLAMAQTAVAKEEDSAA